jgi:hypothetical protein
MVMARRAKLDRDSQAKRHSRTAIPDGYRIAPDGRVRVAPLRGRGQPSIATSHGLNLRLAIAELEACHELVVRAVVSEMTPVQRREHRANVAAKIGLAVRLAEDVAEPANGRGPE